MDAVKELEERITHDEEKAQELDVEISRVQREIISNAKNRIATKMLILRLIDDVENSTLYRVRAGKLDNTLKKLD